MNYLQSKTEFLARELLGSFHVLKKVKRLFQLMRHPDTGQTRIKQIDFLGFAVFNEQCHRKLIDAAIS